MFVANEDPYKKFQESIGRLSGKMHIMDASIPLDVQSKYFALLQRARKDVNEEKALSKIDLLFDPDYALKSKKVLLVSLATLDKVEAYRAIERYAQNPDEELRHWANLSLQESRITLERSFSDEEHILVSTGLGGKGEKLRFLAIFYSSVKDGLNDFQQKTAKKELEYVLEKYNCDIEDVSVNREYVAITALFPFQLDIKMLLGEVLAEINQFGNFLMQNYVVTNVKIFDENEIMRYKTSLEAQQEKD